MSTLEVDLTELTAEKLRLAAERLHLSPQELVIISVEEKLIQLDLQFQNAADYVLEKNSDLYKRLA